MLYAITSQFIDDCQEKRQQARPAHLDRLTALQNEGRLILAGPHPAIDSEEPGTAGFTGSLIVAEFDSQQSAQAWADTDPYAAVGIYAQLSVKPFIQVFPK